MTDMNRVVRNNADLKMFTVNLKISTWGLNNASKIVKSYLDFKDFSLKIIKGTRWIGKLILSRDFIMCKNFRIFLYQHVMFG